MPILTMFEKIRCQMMNRLYAKQKEAVEKWRGKICPKIRKKVERHADCADRVDVFPSGAGILSLKAREETHVVDINVGRCDCHRWQLTCSHAIACFREDDIIPEDRVHGCYSIDTYLRAYGNNIMPIRDKQHWEKMNGVEVNPPIYEKKVGRPKKSRRKEPMKIDGGTKLSKHGAIMHCSICKSDNHTKRNHNHYVGQNQHSEPCNAATDNEEGDPTVLQVPIEVIFA